MTRYPLAVRRLGASLSALAFAFPVVAQPVEKVLTLKEAVQKAVLSNPEVLSRWHTLRAAGGERDAGAGALLPRVDLSAGVGSEQRNSPTFSGSRYDRNLSSLTITQLLYDGFATRNEIRRLDHVRLARLFEFFDTSESVALEAVRAYFDVLRYRELVRLAEDNFVQHRAVFDQTDRRVKARVARAVDLEQISARLALAEANLLTETSNLHDTTARFQRIIGQLPTETMPLPAPLTSDIPPDAGTAVQESQRRNGALRAAIENVRASDAALSARGGAFHPRVDLRLRRDQGTNIDNIQGNSSGTVAEFVVSWNLFNGMSDRARQRQLGEQLNVARDLRDKTCRDIRQTLLIAYNDVRKLREQMGYLDQNRVSVEKARNAYRQQFDIGQRTLLDLLDTENELFQAKRAVANAEQDLNISYARAHAGIGTLLPALELSKIETGVIPGQDQWNEGEDASQQCPPEPVVVYTVDKDALILRAVDLQKQTAMFNARERALQESATGPVAASTAAAPDAPRPATPATPAPAGLPPAGPAAPTPGFAGPLPAGRAPAGGATATADAATQTEVRALLERWRAAWSARDIDAYLGFYAADFVPAKGEDRAAWKAKRQTMLGRASDVSVDISDLVVTLSDATHARVTFKQTYRSASYRDVVAKTMQWEKANGRWLITRESSAGAAP